MTVAPNRSRRPREGRNASPTNRSLATLADGEAWVWSPHYLKKMERFRFRLSHTFDSGATPTNHRTGSRRRAATLSDVDVASIAAKMTETIARAVADDPRELQKKISSLTKALAHPQRKPGEWNELEITLDGPSIIVMLNGQKVTDYQEGEPVPPKTRDFEPKRGPRPLTGYIGVQNHDARSTAYFKEIAVKKLPGKQD